ncbi:hypothetical protein QVD17_33686 [Tagetes erecta]|uniref:Uncharacterized protein n=1 Tax=Tagetes erecta TaxID=13708 RepID=A0AAD8JYZ8_TARER|nr:hypothetical protein QVD17_33686 [Tagetes erecta]
MSLGYAEKLSYIEDVGNVGMTEIHDPPHILQEKQSFETVFSSFALVRFVEIDSTFSSVMGPIQPSLCVGKTVDLLVES